MVAFFTHIYDYFKRNRRGLLVLFIVVCALGAGGLFFLDFKEDISAFLPSDKKNERIHYAYSHIGAANKIVINVSMGDTTLPVDRSLIMDAVDHLCGLLEKGPVREHIKGMTSTVDPSEIMEISRFVTSNMVYFLDSTDYIRIDSLITPQGLRKQLSLVKKMLLSPAGMVLQGTFTSDPLMISGELLSGLQGFKLNDQFELYDNYIFSKDGKEAVITVESAYQTSETDGNGKLIEALDQAVTETVSSFGGKVSVVPFGASYIARTNASQIKKDSMISVSIALVVILLLLILYFRNLRDILLIGASVGFGSLIAFSLSGLLTDSFSLIAIGAGSIIMGIAVNYPLHFLSHVRDGYPVSETLNDIVSPLTTGNITTVGAFLSLLFISSPAMRNFGLFASLLLLGTVLFVLVFLPHITREKTSSPGFRFGMLGRSSPDKNRFVVTAVLLITVVLWFFSPGAEFDTGLQSINYMTAEQRARMGKMLDQTQGSQHIMYYVSEGSTLDAALRNYEESQPVTDTFRHSGIGPFVPSSYKQKERIAQWNAFWEPRRERLLHELDVASSGLGFKPGAFEAFATIIKTDYQARTPDYFEPLIRNMAGNYLSVNEDKSLVFSILHVSPDEAHTIEEQLNAQDGNNFAFDSGSITRIMVNALSADFDYVLYICGIIVFLFLTLSFGRIELSIISFLPLAISWVWILGIMGLLGLRFNIVNIILATFIFGMGDDYTIFMTEGMMYEYSYRKKMLGTYKNTVALSALIMLTGIGSLIVARHPAMRSLAEVTIIGMLSVVVTTYIVPPFLYRLITTKKGKYREEPLTLKNSFYSAFAFLFFIFGSVYLTLTGFFLLTLGGRTDKHKLVFHKRLAKVSAFVLFRVPEVKTRLINKYRADFDKPSVIIANHQSHLDLMALIMLHPKIIILTNRRTWHSPFYGLIIRYADFLPVGDNLDLEITRIRSMVQKGYSVAVFPEGTRSRDCSILRFHKGAFHLAQELGLDITPVLLHGFGHVLPKEDLLLRKGQMTVEILPVLRREDILFSKTLAEQSRIVRKIYIAEYARIAGEIEDVDYFANKVIHNYIYKGRSVERTARKVMCSNRNFRKMTEQLPLTGEVTIEDRHQGAFALTAALVRKNLKINAYIADPLIRELASHCVSVPDNLCFIHKMKNNE